METRLKIMLILAFLGILLLMFLSLILPPKSITISEISDKDLNKRVQVTGQIINIKEYNNNTFQVLIIKQNNASIKGISNSLNSLVPLINKSKNYTITGIIEKNNQTLQINIQEIKNVQ